MATCETNCSATNLDAMCIYTWWSIISIYSCSHIVLYIYIYIIMLLCNTCVLCVPQVTLYCACLLNKQWATSTLLVSSAVSRKPHGGLPILYASIYVSISCIHMHVHAWYVCLQVIWYMRQISQDYTSNIRMFLSPHLLWILWPSRDL